MKMEIPNAVIILLIATILKSSLFTILSLIGNIVNIPSQQRIATPT